MNRIKELEREIRELEIGQAELIDHYQRGYAWIDYPKAIKQQDKEIRWRNNVLIHLCRSENRAFSAYADHAPDSVQLASAWVTTLVALILITGACIGITCVIHPEAHGLDPFDGIKSQLIGVLGYSFLGTLIASFVWLPGLLTAMLHAFTMSILMKTTPVYLESEDLDWNDPSWIVFRCCRRGHSLGAILTLLCAAIIVICDVVSLFIPDAWAFSLIMGFILSIGGMIVISRRAITDIVREKRRWRWLL